MAGPIVTWVPGNSSCTACAITCAASWRISSRASSLFAVMMSSAASCSIKNDVSTSSPSILPANAALARPGPISAATSRIETARSKFRAEPSGRVICGIKRAPSVATPTEGRVVALSHNRTKSRWLARCGRLRDRGGCRELAAPCSAIRFSNRWLNRPCAFRWRQCRPQSLGRGRSLDSHQTSHR